jgi:hypothetical protein
MCSVGPPADARVVGGGRVTAQVSKLQLGKNKTTTAFFDSCVVIHANFEPYAISLLAEPNANIGLITALVPDIKEFLEPIRSSQR